MGEGVRVLVTGSRDWPHPTVVWAALDGVADNLKPGETMTVVHGDCPKGADHMAHQWCAENASFYESMGVTIREEPHPADWKRYGRRVGPLRNAEMVNAGADVCYAFILNESAGASGTADLADEAGITTRRFEISL